MGSFEDRSTSGTVFNIQKYSVHDGPGIRTLVFLKGCPLSCQWCSNPESQCAQPELAFNTIRCLGIDLCGHCLQACPYGAITQADSQDKKLPQIDRSICRGCSMPCASSCPSKALLIYGKKMSVAEILDEVEKDGVFYNRSEGGLTLSGGEPTMQPDFGLALLREARHRHIDTAMETSGLTPWPVLWEFASLLDTILYDIKHTDPAVHHDGTHAANRSILDNITRLGETFPEKRIQVRTPVIPGFNDNESTIRTIAEHIKPYPNISYEMLAYHRLGTQKYQFLGREYPLGEVRLDSTKMSLLTHTAQEILGSRALVSL